VYIKVCNSRLGEGFFVYLTLILQECQGSKTGFDRYTCLGVAADIHAPPAKPPTMASFTFTPTVDVPVSILENKSTHAKLRVEPIDAYVDAIVRPVPGRSDRWTATINTVPQSATMSRHDHQAVLCLSQGELGKHLGSIELGAF